jgi:hypothetical protein
MFEVNKLKQEAAETSVSSAQAKKKPEYETVTMTDGRLVNFPGGPESTKKTRVLKDYWRDDDGSVWIRLDFRNGDFRKIRLPDDLIWQFAGHGGIQKYGDSLANVKGEDGSAADIEDLVLTIDELDAEIQAGNWSTRKVGDGMSGTSVLVKAMVEYGQKTVEQVKTFLKDKDKKFKDALRADDKRVGKNGLTLAATVKKIEAEKAAKGPKVDTATALDEFDTFAEG